jgi:hypothetical protein
LEGCDLDVIPGADWLRGLDVGVVMEEVGRVLLGVDLHQVGHTSQPVRGLDAVTILTGKESTDLRAAPAQQTYAGVVV